MAAHQAPANDKPPSGQGAKGAAARSHHAGTTKRTRVAAGVGTVHFLGAGALARADGITGDVLLERTPAAVDAWMVAYDADPAVRKWMDLIFTGTPWIAIGLVYMGVATESMKRHNVSLGDLFKTKEPAPPSEGMGVPSGATAPATGPSEPPQSPLGTIPEEGLPHDVELLVRQISRETGRPYDEVRAAALAQMAEFTATQNGASGQMPRALGEVIG